MLKEPPPSQLVTGRPTLSSPRTARLCLRCAVASARTTHARCVAHRDRRDQLTRSLTHSLTHWYHTTTSPPRSEQDEIGALAKRAAQLEATLDVLQRRAGKRDAGDGGGGGDATTVQTRTNTVLREALRSQQHALAGLRSMVAVDPVRLRATDCCCWWWIGGLLLHAQ